MIIYGRNAIRETLLAGRAVSLYVLKRNGSDSLVNLARKLGVDVVLLSNEGELTKMAKNPSHQGFVAICKDIEPVSLEALLLACKEKKNPLLLMLDGIEDPQNLGAILRTSDAFGVDGVILKKRGEAPLNATVAKVSTGAINYVKVAVVSNLSQTIMTAKKNGFWVVSSDGEARQSYDEVDYNSPILLIVGSEGFGISSLLIKNSDFVVKIPMFGHVNSLNASVATAVLVSQIVRSRKQ